MNIPNLLVIVFFMVLAVFNNIGKPLSDISSNLLVMMVIYDLITRKSRTID